MRNSSKGVKSRQSKARSGARKDVPAVELRSVDFAYEDKKNLDDISFKVNNGEIKVILSSSGGGKSTILKLILGLLKPDAGEIFVDGQEITKLDEDEMQHVRDNIGMVFQEGALFDSLSVYDNVAFRLKEHDVPEEEIEEEVLRILHFVNLEKEIEKLPSELSGGMQKRVGIARALVGSPKTVLFDEPTAFLDPITCGTICDLIIKLRDVENVACLVVTHEMNVVKHVTSERAVVQETGKVTMENGVEPLSLPNTSILMLKDGRVIFDGSSHDFAYSDDPYIRNFIHGTEVDPTAKHAVA
jgi:phospholipid/cholesterol/gamma-HCH transport system ATP-binding protein